MGRLMRFLGPSWSRVGTSGIVVGTFCRDLGAVLGPPLGVLGASWGILRPSWPRLGASWGRLGSNSKETLVFGSIFDANLNLRNLKNQAPAAGRARFFKNRFWMLRLILYPILVPDWLYFRSFLGVLGGLGASWGVLGTSWRVLATSCGVFGPSWEPLGASWRRVAAFWSSLARLGSL